MVEVILAFLIPGIIIGLWIWIMPSCPSPYGPEDASETVTLTTTAPKDKPKSEIIDELLCIGGPLNGEFVNIPRNWGIFQHADMRNDGLIYYSSDNNAELMEQSVSVTTYLRGEIVFPALGHSYQYLYEEGLDKYMSGVRAAHVLGHRSKR